MKDTRESGLLESHNEADACVGAMSVPVGGDGEDSLCAGGAVVFVGVVAVLSGGVGAWDAEPGTEEGIAGRIEVRRRCRRRALLFSGSALRLALEAAWTTDLWRLE